MYSTPRFLIFILSIAVFANCRKPDEVTLPPTLQLDSISAIQMHNATLHGTSIEIGTDQNFTLAFCISKKKDAKPSLSNSHVVGRSKLEKRINELAPGQQYFVKAFAYNNLDTSFSEEVSFTTWGGKLKDVDNNEYESTQIGEQIWMTSSLRTAHYKDGTPVEKSPFWYGSGYRPSFWNGDLDNNGVIDQNDSIMYIEKFGLLYKWSAANNVEYDGVKNASESSRITNEASDVCPEGWHLPSEPEFEELISFVRRNDWSNVEFAKLLKSTSGWSNGNNGTNETGFNLEPSGYWSEYGQLMGISAYLWSSTEGNAANAIGYRTTGESFSTTFIGKEIHALPVRCVRDYEALVIRE